MDLTRTSIPDARAPGGLDPATTTALLSRAHASVDEPDRLLTIALRLLAGGQPSSALEVFELGRRFDAERVEFGLGRSACHLQQSAPQKARAQLEALLERHPDSAIGHLQLARAQHQLEGYEAAIGSLLRAIALDPTNLQMQAYLFNLHAERGEPEQAVRCLEQLATSLGSPGPVVFLARLAFEAGEPGKAARLLDDVTDALDDAPLLHEEVARLLLSLDRAPAVVELLEGCVDELDIDTAAQLGLAYHRMGEVHLAQQLLGRLEGQVVGGAHPGLRQLRRVLTQAPLTGETR